jgi:hypothetical protein
VDQSKASVIAQEAWVRLSGEEAWTVSDAGPYGDDLWLVVLADRRRERFATLVLDEDGSADMVCLEEYRSCG